MKEPSAALSYGGNSPVKIDYGAALLSQKGGWTLGEMVPPGMGREYVSGQVGPGLVVGKITQQTQGANQADK